MKNNINETELNILNNKSRKSILHYIGIIIYCIFKIILEAVYIIVCFICSIIEGICWILTFKTGVKTLYKKGKRTKRRF